MTTHSHDRDRAQTARDFRAAAALIREKGHTREVYAAPSGALCAAGALQAATGYIVLYRREPATLYEEQVADASKATADGWIWDYSHNTVASPDSSDRMTNAMNALGPLLPTAGCGDRCDGADSAEYHTRLSNAEPGSRKMSERVFHFNDYICESGEALAVLFDQAAEKQEAEL